jgi:hypothetical protein
MLYLRLIILSVGYDVSIDSETLLMIDFVNLKIKLSRSFRSVHKSRICVCVFIDVSAYICMRICVYTVFLKKELRILDGIPFQAPPVPLQCLKGMYNTR